MSLHGAAKYSSIFDCRAELGRRGVIGCSLVDGAAVVDGVHLPLLLCALHRAMVRRLAARRPSPAPRALALCMMMKRAPQRKRTWCQAPSTAGDQPR